MCACVSTQLFSVCPLTTGTSLYIPQHACLPVPQGLFPDLQLSGTQRWSSLWVSTQMLPPMQSSLLKEVGAWLFVLCFTHSSVLSIDFHDCPRETLSRLKEGSGLYVFYFLRPDYDACCGVLNKDLTPS